MADELLRAPVLYIDCTSTIRSGLNTGIQRVVRALINQAAVFSQNLAIDCIPIGYQFNAFYRVEDAKKVALDTQADFIPVKVQHKDIYFCPDAFWTMDMHAWYPFFRGRGLSIATLIYDIIPITHPWFFTPEDARTFEIGLLDVVRGSDLLPCISRETQRALIAFCHAKGISLSESKCPVIPLAPAMTALPVPDQQKYKRLPKGEFFLMVGTIEPRRGYLDTLREYSKYRDAGGTAELLIVGKRGTQFSEIIWQIDRLRPTVTWLEDADDRELAGAYQRAIAVICSSRAEGYGMSVAEGLAYNGRVLANRLPVFQEFAGAHPYYFDIELEGELARLMAKAKTLAHAKHRLNLGSWADTARAIATQLARIA